MIEGLRLLAWFQEFIHRQTTPPLIADCGKCMKATTQINRQGRGCGHEPDAPPGVAVTPWQPPLSKLGYKHGSATACAGYTTRLPEVIEAARAHAHWSKGQLDHFLGGDRANENLIAYIEILDAEVQSLRSGMMTSIADGGGRDAQR